MIRKAIIVGATSGIGLEVARILRGEGVELGVAGRRSELLEAFCSEPGVRAVWRDIDVTAAAAADRLRELIGKLGGADLIMLVAGVGWQNPALDPSLELATVATNVEGFTRMIDAAFAYFRSRGGGHIAVVSSIAGTKGLGAAPAYSATKRYQNTYVQCLAQLSAMTGSRIALTDIRPGFVDTALLGGGSYPLLMRPERVARSIVRAVRRRKRVAVIDWRYRVVVALWRLIPGRLWERLAITNDKNKLNI